MELLPSVLGKVVHILTNLGETSPNPSAILRISGRLLFLKSALMQGFLQTLVQSPPVARFPITGTHKHLVFPLDGSVLLFFLVFPRLVPWLIPNPFLVVGVVGPYDS